MALGSFTADLSKFALKAKLNGDQVMQKVCFEVFSRVVQRTPVDTARARTGFQVGVNSMPSGSDPGPRVSTRKKGQRLTTAPPLSAEDRGRITTGTQALKFGDTGWLVNNVEYVQYLEYGTASYGFSQQAPAGMVRITLSEFQSHVAKAVASLP